MKKSAGAKINLNSINPDSNFSNRTTANGRPIKAPSVALLALEMRVYWEFAAGLISWPLLRLAPKGDGHPVLVFPGLGAGNLSTLLLRQFLKDRGYAARTWRFNRNLGPRPGVISGCLEQVADLYQWYGQKVTLIGWSLGGFYAREIAKIMPDAVRSVITLATPFNGPPKANNAWYFYEFFTGKKVGEEMFNTILSEPPPLPTTSIYSKSDGIVSWQSCLQDESAKTENIEVIASHLGMGAHPFTLFVIADRLAQAEDDWQPFKLSRLLANFSSQR
jgi:pimeloyl-ACP methyl ester carboxylesterase